LDASWLCARTSFWMMLATSPAIPTRSSRTFFVRTTLSSLGIRTRNSSADMLVSKRFSASDLGLRKSLGVSSRSRSAKAAAWRAPPAVGRIPGGDA